MSKWDGKVRKPPGISKQKKKIEWQTELTPQQLQRLGINTENSLPIKTLDVSHFQVSLFPHLHEIISGRTIQYLYISSFPITSSVCNLLEGTKVGQKLIIRKTYVPMHFVESAFSDWIAEISEECIIHVEIEKKREESIFFQLLGARCCVSNSEVFRPQPIRLRKSFHLNKLTMLGNLSSLKLGKVIFLSEDEERRFFRSFERATPSLKEIELQPIFMQKLLVAGFPGIEEGYIRRSSTITVSFSRKDMMSIWRLRLPATVASFHLTMNGPDLTRVSLHVLANSVERCECAGGPNFPVEIEPAYNLAYRLYARLV